VSDILSIPSRNEKRLPQIIAEALIALIMFLPGTALSMAPLKDVTYRGELSSRYVNLGPCNLMTFTDILGQ
jgi:hypothetical protein